MVGAHNPMKIPNAFSFNTKNRYNENKMENNTHINNIISDMGTLLIFNS
jgi:hypothetical protein